MLQDIFQYKDPNDYILIWNGKTKKSTWFQDPEEAEQFAIDNAETGDMYFGLGISPENYGACKRCKADNVVGITAFWIDVDIKNENHAKSNLPETWDDAYNLVFKTPYPSYVVSSGGGLHAYWLLDRVYTKDEVGGSLQKWQQSFAGRYEIDATHDFSRVLRVPETYNHKGGEMKDVEVVSDIGTRYSLHDLTASVLSRKIAIFCENDDEFKSLWNHQMKNLKDDSQSAYDMRIANALRRAYFDADDIKEALIRNRKEFSPKAKKQDMNGYLDRTLAKVYNPRNNDFTPPVEYSEDERIVKVLKTTSSTPVYYLEYASGEKLKLHGPEFLMSYAKYKREYFTKFNKIPAKMKQADWEMDVNRLMENIELIDTGEDSTDLGALSSLISEYVSMMPKVTRAEVEDSSAIIETQEGLWLPGRHMRRWMKDQGATYSNVEYSTLMKELGLDSQLYRAKGGLRFTVWGIWEVEEDA